MLLKEVAKEQTADEMAARLKILTMITGGKIDG